MARPIPAKRTRICRYCGCWFSEKEGGKCGGTDRDHKGRAKGDLIYRRVPGSTRN